MRKLAALGPGEEKKSKDITLYLRCTHDCRIEAQPWHLFTVVCIASGPKAAMVAGWEWVGEDP